MKETEAARKHVEDRRQEVGFCRRREPSETKGRSRRKDSKRKAPLMVMMVMLKV